jgi:hypothetical protein
VCVECLILKSPGQASYGAKSACAKRAAYPGPPPVVPLPESLTPQAAYTEALLPRSGSGPNCLEALGSSPGLLQGPILWIGEPQ